MLYTRSGRRLPRISAGRGPGDVALSPTDARIYFANSGSGTITFASGYSLRRLPGRVRVGKRLVQIAVQPGCSLLLGTAGPDRLKGDRGLRPDPRARRQRHAQRLSRLRHRRGRRR